MLADEEPGSIGKAAGFGRRLARQGLRFALDLIYPPLCMACKAATGTSDALCPQCWREMRFISRPYCERLGTPLPVDYGGELLSPAAIADPPVFAKARAVAVYDGTARQLLHRLKFNDRLELAKGMGRMMAAAGDALLKESDVLVPVPLHWMRGWSRRFNQATELARVISRHSGVPMDIGLLERVKNTRTQVGLTQTQRRDNLQGAFKAPQEAGPRLAGKRVLLIDDVLTTSATANAASRALLRGGAASVSVLTFARVVTEG